MMCFVFLLCSPHLAVDFEQAKAEASVPGIVMTILSMKLPDERDKS